MPVFKLLELELVGLAEDVKLIKNLGDSEHIKLWKAGEVAYIEGITSCPQPIGSGRELLITTSCRIKGKWVIDFNKRGMEVEALGDNRYKFSRMFTIPGFETGPHKATIKFLQKELGSVDFVINKS